MPIYYEDALPLMEEFMKAEAIDAQAMKDLFALVKSGCTDQKLLDSAFKSQEEAHDKACVIYGRLQEVRLDK